jgi:hypothetical protein
MAEQLPVTTANNQQYGQRLAQQRSQEAVPMAQSPTNICAITCPTTTTNSTRIIDTVNSTNRAT